MTNLLAKLGLAGTVSVTVAETSGLDTLYNALISLAVSVVSVLAVEGVEWLRKKIVSKTPKDKKEPEEKE